MSIHNFIKSIEWTNFKMPLFYESNYGLRFDTRTQGIDIGTLEYFDNAVEKAITLFLDLFEDAEKFAVVINSIEEKGKVDIERWSLNDEVLECFEVENIEMISEVFPYIYGDDDTLLTVRTLVRLDKKDFHYYELIKRICRQDIGRSPSISDEVYILNDDLSIAYNFYDDRGLDIGAESGELLRGVYNLRKDWLYDYDRNHVIKC
ncbi:MAG: DUF3885 domain-containing protein [Firmicutes bacterium]|jgi:hypothetical protein|nr:DUF3885 domain-containing protein [Bacillota bacterium]